MIKDNEKRDNFFKKWLKEPTQANRKDFARMRRKFTKQIQEAKREHNFENLGNNSSLKKIYCSFEAHERKNIDLGEF